MSGTLPPFFEPSPFNRGPVAVVFAASSVVILTLIAGIRFSFARHTRVAFELDDLMFSVAAALAIVNAICTAEAVTSGLGRHIDTLTASQVERYFKYRYTADIVGVLSMAASKFSVAMLFKRIASTATRSFYSATVYVSLWTIFAVFALAFQCPLPSPWVYSAATCTASGKLQYAVIAFNMITDVLLATSILPTIWRLNMAQSMRIRVMTLFGSRLIVPLLTIGQLISLNATLDSDDQTWSSLPMAVWTLTLVFASVVSSTIPRTHTFWSSLHTGKAGAAVTDYEMSGGSKNNSGNKSRTGASRSTGTSAATDGLVDSFSRRKSGLPPRRDSDETPLRLVPDTTQTNQIQTRIYADDLESSASSEHTSDPSPLVELEVPREPSIERHRTPAPRGSRQSLASQPTVEDAVELRDLKPYSVWKNREFTVEVEYAGQNSR